jgi:hypothetical protein
LKSQFREAAMFNLQIGQELEFVEPASTEDQVIPKDTRVRVGAIMNELMEPKVTLVVLSGKSVETLTVARHIVTMHCRLVQKSR